MANLLKIKRGTRAQLNAAVTGNSLNLGEPYLITDENRIAVGTGSNSYEVFAKSSEIQALDADLTAISGLTGTGFLKRTGTDTWALDTNTYLTAESDTLSTVTGRGASTTTAITLSGGVTINAAGSTNGAIFAGSTSGTTKVVASAIAGSTTITLPATTGTVALTSDLPTVNNGTFTLNIGTAAASGASVTISAGTGYSANSATNTTYSVSVGPSLSALATFMATGTAGFIKRTGIDTYAIDTSTYLTANQSISISGDASGSGATAITLTLASVGTAGTYTKVTTDAKGRVTSGTTLSATDIPTLTASKISDFDTQVRTSTVAQLAAPAAALAMNSQKITGLADPTAAQDAATKNYVDLAIQGLDPKASVKAATTADLGTVAYANGTSGVGATITNTGTLAAFALDGLTLSVGDRVLIKDQTAALQNGIYTVTTAGSGAVAWVLTRATDNDTWAEIPATFVFVEQGTVNADNGYLFTADQGGTMGTTAITVTQFSGAGQITAGNGLTKSGNTINVVGTSNRISVAADSIDIDANYAGQSTIVTLGTVTTGTWNATAIGVTKGGLGLTAAVTGLLKGDGSAYAAAVAGTDYLSPASTIDGGTF
jgi:hypothetical protein